MRSSNCIFFNLFFALWVCTSFSQTREISGKINAEGSVEGIHVINRTSYRYATSDQNGNFKIQAKLSDTLYFSSIQYSPKSIIISIDIVSKGYVFIELENYITELDEVTIGNILTGDLYSDINNSNSKRAINFYDLGIPGYTGIRKTQIQYRLKEANEGKWIQLGIPPGFNFWKALNRLSGRTKRLKNNAKIEKDKNILNYIKNVVGPELFKNNNLDESLRAEFYYYCSDDPSFYNRCTNRSDVEIMQFLSEKLIEFKIRISSKI